ncbi:MAG: DNA-binding domain-containing protein [Pseudomonadota bacterium]
MIVDQTTFRDALLDPSKARPEGLSNGHGRKAGRRFDVYRNNVTVALTEALETAFPNVAKLVGADNFKVLAQAFVRQNPPSSPLMMFYGGEMPAFLRTFEPTRTIGYLPDIAELELALRQSYHAEDSVPIDPAVLQQTAPDDLMGSRIGLAPSLRLIQSAWPIHAVWRFNNEPGAPKPVMAAEDIVILRPELDPAPHLLPAGGGVFIASLLRKKTFGEAVEAASSTTECFDLTAMLGLLIGAGALTELELAK